MSWILTPLKSGAPVNSGYTWNITGLSATTDYAYRAYVIIDGIAYYGETCYGRTCIAPTYSPSGITTGIAQLIGENDFTVSANTVGYKDGLPLQEYGVLFTQNSFWGTDANLKYENLINVGRRYVCADAALPLTYNVVLTGLTADMLTYYRAYAKNGSGVGYGTVCTQQTAAPPFVSVTACICVASNWYNEQQGYICLDPPLTTGQWAQLSINYNQTNCGSSYADIARIRIYCKPDGVPYYSEITTAIDPDYYMCTDVSRFCGYGGGQIMINCGDEICFSNQVESMIGSCSSFCIHPYDSSPDVNISVHPDYCENCIVIT